jgi:hypothetical protein
MAIRVFYSYAPEDEKLQVELQKHLTVMKRNNEITDWSNWNIKAGEERRKLASRNLANAQIILLLLSTDYLASDYRFDHEMRQAIQLHMNEEARVIPIILRPCDWKKAKVGEPPFSIILGDLQALPKDGKPIKTWKYQDEAFLDVVNRLREAIAEIEPVSRTDAYKPEIPDILPYLCDRSDQEDMLEIALGQEGGKRRRPFVCVVHGDEDECHDKFRERLQQFSLPRFFDVDTSQLSIRAGMLKWPSPTITRQAAQEILRKHLAERLTGRRTASIEEVTEEISRSTAPVMVYSHLSSEDWHKGVSQMIEAFMTFWDSFPDLPLGARLISCLFITHVVDKPEAVKNKGESVRYLKELMTFTITSHSLDSLRQEGVPGEALDRLTILIDRKVVGEQAFLTAVRASLGEQGADLYAPSILKAGLNLELGGYERISGLILPELTAISEHEAKEWIQDDRLFRDFCRRHSPSFCNTDGAINDISELYNDLMTLIPMRPLARDLKQLIERNRC